MEVRIKGIIAEVIEEKGAWLVEVETMPDQRLPSLWTNSCFVATVGGAPLSVIKRYAAS